MYSLLANLVLIVHLTFVVFVLCGGLLGLRWQWVAWLHVPAAIWGAVVEFTGWICPLTPLENWLREQGNEAPYRSDFIAQHLLPLLYPEGLTHTVQLLFGTGVVVLNAAVYWGLWQMQMRRVSQNRQGSVARGM